MEATLNFTIQGNHQKPIISDLFYNKTDTKKPFIIFCHGYKGFKDWGVFGKMEHHFVNAGCAFLRFNFSHNGGTLKQPIDFPDLEAFGNNNYSIELDDLQSVLNWVFEYKKIHSEIDINNIILIGHSRGGAIATIKAAEDSRIKKLITWASVCDLQRTMFQEGEELTQWKKEGVFFIVNGRTKQEMPHYIQFYNNYTENKERLSVKKAVNEITIPHLIIHGDGDLAVPFLNAENLHSWNPKSELFKVKDANHVFGAKHPLTENNFPKSFELVLEKTLEFLKTH